MVTSTTLLRFYLNVLKESRPFFGNQMVRMRPSTFDMIYPEGTLQDIKMVPMGQVDVNKLAKLEAQRNTSRQEKSAKTTTSKMKLPALDTMLNLDDFIKTAKQCLSKTARAYYYSASDDMITKYYNNTIYKSLILRPRIFIDVANISTECSILGYKTTLPLFVGPSNW